MPVVRRAEPAPRAGEAGVKTCDTCGNLVHWPACVRDEDPCSGWVPDEPRHRAPPREPTGAHELAQERPSPPCAVARTIWRLLWFFPLYSSLGLTTVVVFVGWGPARCRLFLDRALSAWRGDMQRHASQQAGQEKPRDPVVLR